MKRDEAMTLLSCLCLILVKVRREGWLSIEDDLEYPENSQLFRDISGDLLVFTVDVLRIMCFNKLKGADIRRYGDLAIANGPWWSSKLGKRIVLETLVHSCDGCAAQTAVEFARQLLPAKSKMTFNEMDEHLRKQHRARKYGASESATRSARIKAIMAELKDRDS